LVQENEPSVMGQDQAPDIERIKRRLDMLDHRLDNIDSMVTAVAERVMKQHSAKIEGRGIISYIHLSTFWDLPLGIAKRR